MSVTATTAHLINKKPEEETAAVRRLREKTPMDFVIVEDFDLVFNMCNGDKNGMESQTLDSEDGVQWD